MEKIKKVLINEIYDLNTNERTRNLYQGYRLNQGDDHQYVFKVEDGLVRMNLSGDESKIIIKQSYSDSEVEIILPNKDYGEYHLSLKNGYSLTMKLHSESLVKTENNIELKFYLLDEKETPVSFHKVIIISEEEA